MWVYLINYCHLTRQFSGRWTFPALARQHTMDRLDKTGRCFFNNPCGQSWMSLTFVPRHSQMLPSVKLPKSNPIRDDGAWSIRGPHLLTVKAARACARTAEIVGTDYRCRSMVRSPYSTTLPRRLGFHHSPVFMCHGSRKAMKLMVGNCLRATFKFGSSKRSSLGPEHRGRGQRRESRRSD